MEQVFTGTICEDSQILDQNTKAHEVKTLRNIAVTYLLHGAESFLRS